MVSQCSWLCRILSTVLDNEDCSSNNNEVTARAGIEYIFIEVCTIKRGMRSVDKRTSYYLIWIHRSCHII